MNRTALVSGGIAGIGAATAKLLKASGYNVIANFSNNQTEADLFHGSTGIPVRRWDVADFDATQSAVAAVAREFGPIDILINNAGITRDSTLHKMTHEQWREVIDVDLGGCFNMCRAVIEGMRQRGFGRIVNVSSVNAQSGQFGQCNYAAAKAGLIGFTKSLALESAAHGITVNAIAARLY
jgi:acetoacetyl-CoA reductase